MCVSILLPIYNTKPDYFQECLDSIYNQTFSKPMELVIINDGSSSSNSHQYETIIQFGKEAHPTLSIILFTLPKNKGIQYALQYGLEKCSYEIVARMDADDIMKPNRLQLQWQILTQYPDIVVLGGQCEIMNERTRIINYTTSHPKIITKDYVKRNSQKHWWINHPTVMYRKSIILKVGGYNQSLQGHSEDMYLWLSLLRQGYSLHNCPNIVLTYRDCPGSLSHNFKYNIKEDINQWIQEL